MRMRRLRRALACVLAMTVAGCGTVPKGGASGLCRALGNELGLAQARQQVDEVFEAGVAAGCWARPRHG